MNLLDRKAAFFDAVRQLYTSEKTSLVKVERQNERERSMDVLFVGVIL